MVSGSSAVLLPFRSKPNRFVEHGIPRTIERLGKTSPKFADHLSRDGRHLAPRSTANHLLWANRVRPRCIRIDTRQHLPFLARLEGNRSVATSVVLASLAALAVDGSIDLNRTKSRANPYDTDTFDILDCSVRYIFCRPLVWILSGNAVMDSPS